MRGAVFDPADGSVEIVDNLEIAEPGPDQVRVDVQYCGLCHSDVSLVDGQFPTEGPIVLGHEAAGIVETVGSQVEDLEPGDKVLLSPIASCEKCYFCNKGDYTQCTNRSAIITHRFPDGSTGLSRSGQPVLRGLGVAGLAEKALVLKEGAIKLPDDAPLEAVSVMGCAVQTGVGAALRTAEIQVGDTVLVIGAGGIGISIVQGCKVAGAQRIIVSDTNQERREQAPKFGATDLIDPKVGPLDQQIIALTEHGVDCSFDAVGSADLFNDAYNATRNGGKVVMVGAGPIDEDLGSINATFFMFSSKKLFGCSLGDVHGRVDVPYMYGLYKSGELDLESMVTKRRPLGELHEAIEDLRSGSELRTLLEI